MNDFEIKAIKNALRDAYQIEEFHKFVCTFNLEGRDENPYDLVIKYKYKNNCFYVNALYEDYTEVDYDKLKWVKEAIKSQEKQINEEIMQEKKEIVHFNSFISGQIQIMHYVNKKEITNERIQELKKRIYKIVSAKREEGKERIQIYTSTITQLKEEMKIDG